MTDQTLHFELPKALVLNANDRTHWAPKAAVTRNLRAMGIRAAQDCIAMGRVHLTVRVGWPDQRRRDVANLSPTFKALLDGIVEGGLISDDSDKYLVGPDLRPYTAGKTGIVVLDFEFTELVDNTGSDGPDSSADFARITGRNSDPAVAQTATGSTRTSGTSRRQD